MIYKVQYIDATDRQDKIDANTGKILIEEQNIFADETGQLKNNYLIFSDIKPIEMQLNDIKNNTDLIILKQEGII